jgi:hypothetical protein
MKGGTVTSFSSFNNNPGCSNRQQTVNNNWMLNKPQGNSSRVKMANPSAVVPINMNLFNQKYQVS